MRTHGLAGTYREYGCRCPECAAAHNERQQRENVQRTARLAEDPTLAPHGKSSTYSNWGCRCQDCTTAHSAACRRNDARVRASRAGAS